jgi:S1-C subfamily serine protease
MKKVAGIVAFATAIVLTPGCVDTTSAQRRASFLPYAATTIGGESLPKFLAARTALLLTADRLSVSTTSPETPGEFTLKANGFSDFGVATAVDSRGYFLTAAHCLGEHAPYLLIASGAGVRAEQATVVWRGDVSKHEPDLALLYVGHPVSRVFAWTADSKQGDRVFALGPDFDQPAEVAMAGLSGVILPPSEMPKMTPAVSSTNHTAPLHHGDSGGPLTDTAGRLLGINVSMNLDPSYVNMGRLKYSEAIRPDLVWLNDMISAHAAKQPDRAPAPAPTSQGGSS